LTRLIKRSPILTTMHSLEPEYLELRADGVIDEPAALRAVALDRGSVFSLFAELRFVLYASVVAITTGVGILLKNNLDRIGPVTLIAALALFAAVCYATAVRTRRRGEERSIGGDYVLLLGALIASADLGYAEAQFHWLGTQWSWHLLMLAVLHAVTAYYFNSRLVLSVSLTSLAGWFGIQGHIDNLFAGENILRQSGMQALACAAVITGWREGHRRTGQAEPFVEILEHFAANTGFWGALAFSFGDSTRNVGMLLVVGLAVISIRKGLKNRQEAFVVYGVAYAALGLCVFEAQIGGSALLITLLELITVIGAVTLLWRFHAQLKAAAA
jgi:Predicted membrane protein (DUF2157)